MKTNRFIFAALSIAAAVSCQKDGFVGQETLRETESAVLVTGEATRTSLNGNVVQWTDDDVIALFDNKNFKNEFNITDVNGAYASFYGEVTSGTTQVYAVYPYNLALGAEGSTLTVNIPEDQTSKVGSFAEEHNISVAKGTKTPGVEAIQSVTFKNVCSQLKFTIPSYIGDATSVTLSASTPIAGVATVDFSGDSPVVSISSEGSKSITMTGSYSAGSMFMFVLAPGTYNGCTVTVATEKANWTITKTSTFTLEPGRYKNLGTLELEQVSTAKASAAHTYSGSTLTGTNVTVNLNIPAATQKYVTALSLDVKNSAGQVVRTSSSVSADQTLAANTSWPYLPQGDYTVSGSYTLADGTEKTISTVSFTSPAPTFEVTSNAYTSYTKYQTSGASAANAVTDDAICDMTSATVTISDAILDNSNYSTLKGGFSYALDGTATTAAKVTGQSWGKHVVTATYTFDGVAISRSTDCHITGLPYSANPPKDSGNNPWSKISSGVHTVKWDGDNVYLEGSSSKQVIESSSFHAPNIIKVSIQVPVQLHSYAVWPGKAIPELVCRIGGNEVDRQKGDSPGSYGSKDKDYTINKTGTISSSNSTVQIENAYTMSSAYIKIYSVTLKYAE